MIKLIAIGVVIALAVAAVYYLTFVTPKPKAPTAEERAIEAVETELVEALANMTEEDLESALLK